MKTKEEKILEELESSSAKQEKQQALNTLFVENKEDQNKNQDYKNNFKEYDIPDKYYLIEMYNKQKELQKFLSDRGKTRPFPDKMSNATQTDIATSIYHLFCMQVETKELEVECDKIQKYKEENNTSVVPADLAISARYELIDIFFFLFNVGIYSGIDINKVLEEVEEQSVFALALPLDINSVATHLLNYIDKLPWKAWKEYDYSTFYNKSPYEIKSIIIDYAIALRLCIAWGQATFNETIKSLFDLYMNKWEENKRRQEDPDSGYVLKHENTLSDISEALQQ